ncbi:MULTISPECIES: SusC/RagA family TonB-linked outer membrane protein [unclassified Proteiniphilum]|jgi:TonB-linked SusC/RagA family outer membrane protein|uniref:SusC/RagA family TonB-linked outer membrane protein n=1 Tax=unclassified Proteiniphilum TaxID=2622718 RepID=UPI000E81EAB9|nr:MULTISPECIES: TonB-dependent receptor [unclassified Proteiniphilum]HBG57845.1 SusC/RagA family protein [Porphyromonadaceae bacterium]
MKLKIASVFSFLLFSFAIIAQQQITVSGTVTEESTGDPAIGVSILVKGTGHGTVTNIDGKYILDKVPVNGTIVFSYIGMITIEIPVNGRSTIDVRLSEDVHALEEVLVIGYGTAKKRDLTGSIASINAEEISNRPSTNILTSLQGKVAGVQVVNTGRAGQDPEIRIRGTNSINGYSPLYVVDGLFSDNINYLNPSDIESMEILKDPSSLAIFGVRGANGVIIVNTKRAKKGQTIVNFNSSAGFKDVTHKMPMTNAAQFKELYNEQRINQGLVPFDYTNWSADTDWQDEIFQKGFITNNNISITGASDKNRFYMGIGYTSEEGNIIHEKYSRLTLNLSSDYSVTNALRFGYQVNASRTLPADAKGVSSSIKAAPVAPVYDETGLLLHTLPDFQRAQVWNPLIDIEARENHNIAENNRAAGNIYGEVDFLKNFNFKTTLSLDYAVAENREYSPIVYVYNPDLGEKENLTTNESLSQSKSTRTVAQGDYILSYQNSFGGHNLTATAGLTTNFTEYSYLGASRSQNIEDIIFSIPSNDIDKWWISSIPSKSSGNSSSQYKRFTMSYLLRALYNYENRYLFNASYRRDGASVFRAAGNTWDNFYSFGGGWVASEEEFIKELSFIDYLKLKGSWGVLGSQNTGGYNYPTYPQLTSSGSAVFGDNIVTGYSIQYLPQDLSWEKTYAWEAGFEINILNNRLRIEPVYYNKSTKDIIVMLSGFSGAKNSLENLGEIQNKGVEISATWTDRIGVGGLNYSLSANLTTIDNKVVSLGRGPEDAIFDAGGISRSLEGYPVGHFFGYKVAGVYQNREDVKTYYPNKVGSVAPGDLKFVDIDGDGEITQDDRTMIGNPTPDFTYGFNISLNYKKFDLGIDLMGVYGNEIYRTWDDPTYAQLNYLTKRMSRWNGEGSSNWEPILNPSRSINLINSEYFIEDGSFFRIRNLQLGYTFNDELLQRIFLKSLRIYANVQNLKTWTRNTGYTPEIGGSALAFGIDGGTYPMPMIYTFGVNLTF